MLGDTEGKRRRRQQRMTGLDSITGSMDMSLSELLEIVEDRGACVLLSMGLQRVGHNLVAEQQQHYMPGIVLSPGDTETNKSSCLLEFTVKEQRNKYILNTSDGDMC